MDKVRLVKMSEHDAWISDRTFFEGKVFEVLEYYDEIQSGKVDVPRWVRLSDVEIPKHITDENESWDESSNEFIFIGVDDNWEVVESTETNKTK